VLESAVEKLGILASLTTDIHNDELSRSALNVHTSMVVDKHMQVSNILCSRGVGGGEMERMYMHISCSVEHDWSFARALTG
jgi:hypothetical protein